jgi:phosphoglycerol geranylgeranyltransferase
MIGSVEKYIRECIYAEGAIHLTLIDPEQVSIKSASQLAKLLSRSNTKAVMIGGSTSNSIAHLDSIVNAIKREVSLPIILFPNDITGISQYADAIWFMSLLNSIDPYFLMGVQVLGAPKIKKYGLEALPLGYIIVGEGGAAGVVGRATPIPYTKPELAVAHVLAAQYLGMRFVYLEAGSGASKPVPHSMIKAVRKNSDIILIVGGGIRSSRSAKTAIAAGADIIITGNILEEPDSGDKFLKLVETVRECGVSRTQVFSNKIIRAENYPQI